jgi:predicted nucleic acid-binding protein
MQLAVTGLFHAKWTDRIHDEWIRNLLQNRRDLRKEQLKKTRRLMNAATQDSLIEGYEHLIESVKLPDEDDQHVLAAAIHSHANVIVTFNLKDFPKSVLRPHEIESLHPDEFILRLIHLDSDAVCLAAQKHRERLRKPPKTADEYLRTLSNQGLAKTVEYLAANSSLI